jgi:hypothetical protein
VFAVVLIYLNLFAFVKEGEIRGSNRIKMKCKERHLDPRNGKKWKMGSF